MEIELYGTEGKTQSGLHSPNHRGIHRRRSGKARPDVQGQTNKRKRKPHILAVINENCTGCSGSPACVDYCPVEDCMYWSPDADHPPFGRIIVDPLLCIGCKLCTSKGPDGAFLEGCPWDAIDMVPSRNLNRRRVRFPSKIWRAFTCSWFLPSLVDPKRHGHERKPVWLALRRGRGARQSACA